LFRGASGAIGAPYLIDRPMNRPSFLAYVEQALASTLRKRDIVFRDNLRTHKIAAASKLCPRKGK
jgi:hypothetical protein